VADIPPRRPLTEREEQVLRGVLEGYTNRRIAGQLGVSEGAVKAVLQQMFDKAGVRTRSQLVRVAMEGWLGTGTGRAAR
jgi:two-component system, NarL family, nitrate/nitrite response regulator NarL